MAKKNSTKTATKEALQNSEPRLIAYRGWQGINIQESPLKWEPIEEHSFKSSNLPTNYLILQNNVDSMDGGGLETRNPDKTYVTAPAGTSFTGVQLMKNQYLYAAFDDSSIRVWKPESMTWDYVFNPAIQKTGDEGLGYQDEDQKWLDAEEIASSIASRYPNGVVDYHEIPISNDHAQYIANVYTEYVLPGLYEFGVRQPYDDHAAGIINGPRANVLMPGAVTSVDAKKKLEWCISKGYMNRDADIVNWAPYISFDTNDIYTYVISRGMTEAAYIVIHALVEDLKEALVAEGIEEPEPLFWMLSQVAGETYYSVDCFDLPSQSELLQLYNELITIYWAVFGGVVYQESVYNGNKFVKYNYTTFDFRNEMHIFPTIFESEQAYVNNDELAPQIEAWLGADYSNPISWTDLAIINDDFVALGARFSPAINTNDIRVEDPQITRTPVVREIEIIQSPGESIIVHLEFRYTYNETLDFEESLILPEHSDDASLQYVGGDIWTGKLNRISTLNEIWEKRSDQKMPSPAYIKGEFASKIDGNILHFGNRRALGTTDNDNFYVCNHGGVLDGGQYQVTWGTFFYTYTNKFGQTMWDTATMNDYGRTQPPPTEWIYNGNTFKQANVMDNMYVSPLLFNSLDYLTLGFRNIPEDAEGIDIYWAEKGSTDQIWIGHIESGSFGKLNEGQPNEELVATFDWYGSLNDTTDWTNANLVGPDQDTTGGVPATMCTVIDNRMYFWGDLQHPERIYIGGTTFNELSVARGTGGAYIDISPGYGQVVHGAYKFKTQSGAAIVTILTGNRNTNDLKRFNLVQTNITVTSDLSETSFMAEEVSNVVGCNSDFGAVVAADGLYTVHRYGVTITTHAMEYNSQLKVEMISDAIEPLFDDRMASLFDNAHMIYIDDKLYIVLADPEYEEELDHVILVYDIGLKAWYTYTYPVLSTEDKIISVFPIDYVRDNEGIGIVLKDRIGIIPTAGSTVISDALDPVEILIQTGELSTTNPLSQTSYVDQLEFRFDYFVGKVTIHLNGVDYFGRTIHIEKDISHDDVARDLMEWMKVGRYLESYNITITGEARFHLTHFMGRVFVQNKRVHSVYGYDSYSSHYRVEHGEQPGDHDDWHEIKNYNDLHRAVVV